MSYDFPDGPDFNPEPQGDEYATPAEIDDDVPWERLSESRRRSLEEQARDLLAADEALRGAAAGSSFP